MSFHPECQKGWVEDFICPWCGSNNVSYIGDDCRAESGVADAFDDIDGVCDECGKPVRIVEVVTNEVYGCYKGEDINDRPQRTRFDCVCKLCHCVIEMDKKDLEDNGGRPPCTFGGHWKTDYGKDCRWSETGVR